MKRRQFVSALGAVGAATRAQAKPEGAAPRQAVLLMNDSVRADMLNCYRHTGLATPNLDRIAVGGIRFERA